MMLRRNDSQPPMVDFIPSKPANRLLWVSSAPLTQWSVSEYISFCGLSGESSVGYKGWGGLGGGSVGGRPPGGTMISSKVGNTSAQPSAQNANLKIKLSGAAPGISIRSRFGETRIGETPDESSQQPSWISPDWTTSSWTWTQSKHTSQINTWKKQWETHKCKITKEQQTPLKSRPCERKESNLPLQQPCKPK